MTAILAVVERRARLTRRLEALVEDGWVDRGGLVLPEEPWDVTDRRWACHGAVSDPAEAATAVLAAARGAAVAVACGDADLRRLLVGDLCRIGQVELEELGTDPLEVLDADQRALLDCLADGCSIPEAANQLFLSPRTAERRMAGARDLLGVRTTAEAIVLADPRELDP